MPKGKHILVCRSGAKLMMSEDGSLAYMGGDAYAMGVNDNTQFDELKSEVADMWKFDPGFITIKYFLPNTSNNLVTISNDKDIRRMLEFYEDSTTVDVYVFTSTSNGTSDVSSIPAIRSKGTTVETVIPCNDVLPRPERVIGVDQVPRNDGLSHPERAIGVDQVPRNDVLSRPERVIGVDQVPCIDVVSRPERVIGVDQVPRSDVLSRSKRVIGVDQVPRNDVLSRPQREPLNELAVYSESEMLKNSKESERFRLAKFWENSLTGVHQQFNSVNDFRDALRKYSVAQGFSCIKTENNSKQFSAKCKGEGCPWEICASKLATSKQFVVRKLNDIHTCGAKKVSSK